MNLDLLVTRLVLKKTLEANLEAVEAAAFEAYLELISHMNNNPSLFIVFSDLKVCDSAACRYSFLQGFDSAVVHFFFKVFMFAGIHFLKVFMLADFQGRRYSCLQVFSSAGIKFCRYSFLKVFIF